MVVDGDPAIHTGIRIPGQHQEAARRDDKRPAIADHMDVEVVVLYGPAVDIDRTLRLVIDLEVLAVRVERSGGVLHDFVDHHV